MPFSEVLSVGYSSYQDEWRIKINSVEGSKKSFIKAVLKQVALPEVVKWLVKERVDTWFEGRHVLQFGINDTLKDVCFFETHNQWLVENRVMPIDLLDE